MTTSKLTIEQKGNLMNEITGSLKTQAFILGREFDGAKMFFDLLDKTDMELLEIHRLCRK